MNDPRALLDRELPPFDAWPCLLVCMADDGTLLQATPAFTECIGIAHEAHPGWVWSALLTAASHAALQSALPLRQSFEITLALKGTPARPGGTWLDGSARWDAERCQYNCVFHDVTARVHAESEARHRADRFEQLATRLPLPVACFDAHTLACRFANAPYAETFGLNPDTLVGRTLPEVLGDLASRELQQHMDAVLHDGRPAAYECERPQPDGGKQLLQVTLLPHAGDDGAVDTAFLLVQDLTAQQATRQALQLCEERLARFMQASSEGIAFMEDGVITDANAAACLLVGRTPDELVGLSTLELVVPDQRSRVADMMRGSQDVPYESTLLHKDGRRLPVELVGRNISQAGRTVRMTFVRDIRERHAAQEHIRYLAHHDALTGLPNRVSLVEDLSHHIAAARRNDSQLALLFIDLDHFKRVNDSLGHLVGDTLLQTIARRITDSLRTTDRVARFGGDEFIVLLPRTLQRSDVEEVSNKLLAAIEVPVNVDGRLISVTPSIGISMFPHDAGTADALIKNADTALYLAKSRGRANHQFFTPAMARSALDALVMESQMSQGLVRGEFVLFFQPQVNAKTGELAGAEALMRWRHPDRGLLRPDAFIELAEQQRLMLPLGQWALREAARCAKRWFESGLCDVRVAVNLSTVQFQTSGFTNLVQQVLREEGVPGRLIELELTERMLMDDLPEVQRKLTELKALGISISVDDFGTGYSSLAHLKELPIDKMKIDRSFVQDLPGDAESKAIARAIIQMSRGLGLRVIAEGVETEDQRQYLADAGCDELQGMHIGAPLDVEEFEQWVRRDRPVTAP